MRFTLASALLAVAATAVAQMTHNVTVGDGGVLKFDPQNITVSMGDKVAFEFRAKNHTVTQSTFADPCTPANINGSAGVDSGFMFIPANNSLQPGQFPTWTITINTTGPLWFHCAQANPKSHCQAGMVFSINETPEKTFDQYLANAMAFVPANVTASPANGTASPTDPAASSAASSDAGASSAAALATSGAANASADPASQTGTPEAAQAAAGGNNSGAATVVVSRGAAGLLAALTLGAMLI